MKLNGIMIALSLSVFALNGLAITNIESQRNRSDKEGLKGAFDVSISGKSGNSDKQSSSASARFDYRSAEHQSLLIAKKEYGESNQLKDTDNHFLHLRYIHHNSATFAWESFVQYQDDDFKLLDSRKLVGGGARFDLSGEQSYQLSVGLGAYYTEEVYQLEGDELRDDYARANTYINYLQQLTASTKLTNTLYWQPRFSQPSDSYVYNNFSLAVKINETLAIKLSLESQYDSQPVASVKHVDHSYYTSLVYSF